jgi:hypothetical protein
MPRQTAQAAMTSRNPTEDGMGSYTLHLYGCPGLIHSGLPEAAQTGGSVGQYRRGARFIRRQRGSRRSVPKIFALQNKSHPGAIWHSGGDRSREFSARLVGVTG